MSESRRFPTFRRMAALCLVLMAVVVFAASPARAQIVGDEPPKLSKAEKAYIKRMIEYGKEEKQYPDRNWILQGCRLNMNGTWYPFDRFSESWFGRMVITGDSIIFEKIGEFPYEILKSEYGPEIPPGGALPRSERHLFKLEQSVSFTFWRNRSYQFVVIGHPPWSKRRNDPSNWHFRCAPDLAMCTTLESATRLFGDKDGFERDGLKCLGLNFIPYTDD
jgi:hypothetical protein